MTPLNAYQDGYQKAVKRANHAAANLVTQIVDRDGLRFEDLRNLLVPTADIEDNLELLADHLAFQHERGQTTLPCTEVDGIPVPVASQHLMRQSEGRQEFKTRAEPIETALGGVTRQLSQFLAGRMASRSYFAAKGITGGMDPTQNMLDIEVHSHTTGGRVSYSPAYFINYIALAAPTSPVRGRILPGRYVFMVTMVGPKSVRDSQPFDVPPSFTVHLAV